MVNVDMFKGAFSPPPAQPQPVPVAVAQPQQVPMAQPQPVYEDPEIAKLKFFFLKWLSLIIGGSAILLIVWRVVLKFF